MDYYYNYYLGCNNILKNEVVVNNGLFLQIFLFGLYCNFYFFCDYFSFYLNYLYKMLLYHSF